MKRQVVDGSISVPLPDEPVARAKAFGELAAAWSQMLSAIDHLLPVGGMDAGGRLTQNAAPPVRYQMPVVYRAPSPFEIEQPIAAPAPVSPEPARANGGDHRTPEHMAKMREAAAKARKGKRGKGKR